MAHEYVTSHDIPAEGEHLDRGKLGSLRVATGGAAVMLALVSVYLLFFAPEKIRASYAYSWLFAFFYFFTIALGGCFWTLLHNVSNSGWGTSVRRTFENLGSVFPWMALFALPLTCPQVQKHLYEWMNIHREGLAAGASPFDGFLGGVCGSRSLKLWLTENHHTLLASKIWYMNLVGWYARFIFFFAGLGLVIRTLRKLSTAQDSDPHPGTARLFKARKLSSWTLVILAVTVTFAGFDWLMGLDYKWFSTMWGVYLFSGAALNSMAVIILVITWLRGLGYLQKVVSGEHYHIMGKLLFAFTVFWAYVSFSQFFLIWYANITEETRYFLVRNTEGWNTASLVLVFGHFVVPFVVLLQQHLKRKPVMISAVAIYTLVMHALDHYLIVIPQRGIFLTHGQDYVIRGAFWGDILAFLTVGAGFLYFLLRAVGQHSLFPHRDPRILESANMSN